MQFCQNIAVKNRKKIQLCQHAPSPSTSCILSYWFTKQDLCVYISTVFDEHTDANVFGMCCLIDLIKFCETANIFLFTTVFTSEWVSPETIFMYSTVIDTSDSTHWLLTDAVCLDIKRYCNLLFICSCCFVIHPPATLGVGEHLQCFNEHWSASEIV